MITDITTSTISLMKQSQQSSSLNKAGSSRVFFELLERVGTSGRYQKILLALLCVTNYLVGGLTLMSSFLFYQDPYSCAQHYEHQTCQEHVCSLPPEQRLQFVPSPTIHTLGNQFGDHRCSDSKRLIEIVQILLLGGRLAGPLALLVVGDLFGRKFIFVTNLIVCLVGISLLPLSPNLTFAGILLLFAMFGAANMFSLGFNFLSECVSELVRQQYLVVTQIFNGGSLLLNVLFYYLVRDWKIIMWALYAVPAAFTLIVALKFMVDTPMCLVIHKQPQEALKDFYFVAKINRFTNCQLSQDQVQSAKESYHKASAKSSQLHHKFNIFDLFRFPSVRKITLLSIALMCTNTVNYFAPPLMLGQFKFDIFISGTVLGVATLVHYPLCYFFIPKYRRQTQSIVIFTIATLSSAVLIFAWKQGSDNKPSLHDSIAPLLLLFVFYLVVTYYATLYFIYYNELFPTQVRVLGTNIANFIKGVLVTLLPLIIDACLDSGFPIMLLFSIVSVASIALSKIYPQTYGKAPPEIIEELRHENREQGEESLIDGQSE